MSYDPEDVGGDPACWLHLFEDDLAGEDDEAAPSEHDGTSAPG